MRVLVLSDIHSNLEALEACLAAAPACDLVANLGDLVGYGACPNEVIERVRALGGVFVRGNHDRAATGQIDISDFNPMARFAALWTRQQLTPENLEWLKTLPQGPVRRPEVPAAQFVHGSPIDEDDYIVNWSDAMPPLITAAASLTFFGHTHHQGGFFDRTQTAETFQPTYKTTEWTDRCEWRLRKNQHYLINPGSVGQPRDGDWRAGFAVFDDEPYAVTFYRVPYNLQRAQERILAAQLPERLSARLALGR